MNQGSGNNTNFSYQFTKGNLTFVHAQELHGMTAALNAAAGYNNGFWLVVPDGAISVLPWIPVQNRNGHESRLSSYGTAYNPILEVDMALHAYETLADESANGGYTQDVIDELEVSLSYSFNHAPDSTANTTPIMAFGFV